MLIISLISLITCKALSFIRPNLAHHFYLRVSTIILLFSSFLVFNCTDLSGIIDSGIGIYGGLFQVTHIIQTIEIILLLIGSLILISWPIKIKLNNNSLDLFKNYTNNNYNYINDVYVKDNFLKNSTNYTITIIFSSLGASLLLSSSDLISMYICIELQSFSLYILATLFKDLENSTSAGLKYFLLGGLASCLILLGSGLVYNSIGLTNFDSISTLISNQNLMTLKGVQLGIVIIFIGFLIKIAAAPLHNWSPDVYDQTPSIVTIWLTIIPKLSILILLFEIFSIFNLDYLGQDLISQILLLSEENYFPYIDFFTKDLWNNKLLKYLLLIVSLISLITGGIVGLNQKHIKRLLAYSTISHLGFILLSLTIFSEQSIESFLFYIIQYSITNLNIFLIIIGLSYLNYNFIYNKLNNNNYLLNRIKDIILISEFKSQFYFNPFISICFSICFFSLAGIPPLIGFFSKQFVLLSSIQEGYYFITIVAIIVSVISASYYLKVIKELYTESQNSNEEKINNNKINYNYFEENNNNKVNTIFIDYNNSTINNYLKDKYILSSSHSYLISTITFFILFFIFKPSLILNPSLIVSLTIFPI